MSCNPEYGGQGMPASISMPVNEMVMGANFSWAHLALLTNSAIRAVDAHASQELKDLYLEKLISGKFTILERLLVLDIFQSCFLFFQYEVFDKTNGHNYIHNKKRR